jgi:hypothetical protein
MRCKHLTNPPPTSPSNPRFPPGAPMIAVASPLLSGHRHISVFRCCSCARVHQVVNSSCAPCSARHLQPSPPTPPPPPLPPVLNSLLRGMAAPSPNAYPVQKLLTVFPPRDCYTMAMGNLFNPVLKNAQANIKTGPSVFNYVIQVTPASALLCSTAPFSPLHLRASLLHFSHAPSNASLPPLIPPFPSPRFRAQSLAGGWGSDAEQVHACDHASCDGKSCSAEEAAECESRMRVRNVMVLPKEMVTPYR